MAVFLQHVDIVNINEVQFLNPRLGMLRIILDQFAIFKEKSTAVHILETVFTEETNA